MARLLRHALLLLACCLAGVGLVVGCGDGSESPQTGADGTAASAVPTTGASPDDAALPDDGEVSQTLVTGTTVSTADASRGSTPVSEPRGDDQGSDAGAALDDEDAGHATDDGADDRHGDDDDAAQHPTGESAAPSRRSEPEDVAQSGDGHASAGAGTNGAGRQDSTPDASDDAADGSDGGEAGQDTSADAGGDRGAETDSEGSDAGEGGTGGEGAETGEGGTGGQDDEPAGREETDGTAAEPEPTEDRLRVLALAVPQLDGTAFAVDTLAGRDVLLWFWAPW